MISGSVMFRAAGRERASFWRAGKGGGKELTADGLL